MIKNVEIVADSIKKEESDRARSVGFGFVCSMCMKLHASDWKNTKGCVGVSCCGPIGGKDYPEYIGPLEGVFHLYCFACGKENPSNIVSVKDSSRLIGVCEDHLELLDPGRYKIKDAIDNVYSSAKEIILRDSK